MTGRSRARNPTLAMTGHEVQLTPRDVVRPVKKSPKLTFSDLQTFCSESPL